MATQPFRFLDLPPELRCIVYEQIGITTKHHTLESTNAPDKYSEITLVRKSLPVQILATCRLINDEAKTFLRPKLAKLRNQPLRFLVDCASATALVDLRYSPLVRCFGLVPDEEREPLSVEAKAFIARCATALAQFQWATYGTLSAERPSDVGILLANPHNRGHSEITCQELIDRSQKLQRICRRARWMKGRKDEKTAGRSYVFYWKNKRCRVERGLGGGRESCRCVKGGGVCSA
jgi:hypothetical protein